VLFDPLGVLGLHRAGVEVPEKRF